MGAAKACGAETNHGCWDDKDEKEGSNVCIAAIRFHRASLISAE